MKTTKRRGWADHDVAFILLSWRFAVHILHGRLLIKKRTEQISVLLYEWTREKHNRDSREKVVTSPPSDLLVGLVVKVYASRAEDPGLIPACSVGIFRDESYY